VTNRRWRIGLEISAELAAQGILNENGRPFAATSIKSMLDAGRRT
jgi:hypothetical protein